MATTDVCYLSATNRALSTVFTSAVSAVLLPLIHGPTVAFFVAWNSYFGVIRICLVSVAGLLVNLFGPRYNIRQPFIAVDGPPNSKHDSSKHHRGQHHHSSIPDTSENTEGGSGSESANEDNGTDEVRIGISLPSNTPHHESRNHREHAAPHGHRAHAGAHGHRAHAGPRGHRAHAKPHGHRERAKPHGHKVSVFPLPVISVSSGHESHGADHHDRDSHDTDGEADNVMDGSFDVEDDALGGSWFGGFDVFDKIRKRNTKVSILGALGLVYSLVYTPVLQVGWMIANWQLATPPLFFARGLSVTIIALPYTLDTHARYGKVFGRMFGSKKVVPRFVNMYMAVANAVLSVIVVALYVRAIEISRLSRSSNILSVPAFTILLFTLVAPLKSLVKKESRPADKGYWGLSFTAFCACGGCNFRKALYGLIVLGATLFLGFLGAGPSISIFGSERIAGWLQETDRLGNTVTGSASITEEDLMGLSSWFHCSSVSWWRKAVQILP